MSLKPKTTREHILSLYGHISGVKKNLSHVHEYVEKVLSSGGSFYGEIIENEIEGMGILTAVYMREPEKNIVEIQNWK